jgi:hypothetical protein
MSAGGFRDVYSHVCAACGKRYTDTRYKSKYCSKSCSYGQPTEIFKEEVTSKNNRYFAPVDIEREAEKGRWKTVAGENWVEYFRKWVPVFAALQEKTDASS